MKIAKLLLETSLLMTLAGCTAKESVKPENKEVVQRPKKEEESRQPEETTAMEWTEAIQPEETTSTEED